jgi:fatty acid desaturase
MQEDFASKFQHVSLGDVMHSDRLRPPREFNWTNKSHLAFDLFWDWSVVFVACWLGYTSDMLVGKLLAILFIGTHLHRLAILGHDGAHFLFAKNRRLNDIVANLLCFYPLGGTVEGYRSSLTTIGGLELSKIQSLR